MSAIPDQLAASALEPVLILSAIAAKLKQRFKVDFKGRHYEPTLTVQAVSWYLLYPLSYRDIEELFLKRGLEVDHSTINRWVRRHGEAPCQASGGSASESEAEMSLKIA